MLLLLLNNSILSLVISWRDNYTISFFKPLVTPVLKRAVYHYAMYSLYNCVRHMIHRLPISIFFCTFKERKVLPIYGHLSPSEHGAPASSSSVIAWLPLLCYWSHIQHYVLIISNWPVKPQQPLQCCMKALTSTNKHIDPVMSCRFLHHYSNNGFFHALLAVWSFVSLFFF